MTTQTKLAPRTIEGLLAGIKGCPLHKRGPHRSCSDTSAECFYTINRVKGHMSVLVNQHKPVCLAAIYDKGTRDIQRVVLGGEDTLLMKAVAERVVTALLSGRMESIIKEVLQKLGITGTAELVPGTSVDCGKLQFVIGTERELIVRNNQGV